MKKLLTIYHGTNGTDGANGTDSTTPKIGVKKASDGAIDVQLI